MEQRLLGGDQPHQRLPPQRPPLPPLPLSPLPLPPWLWPWPRWYFSQPEMSLFLLFLQNSLTLIPALQAKHWAEKARQQNLGSSR